MSRLRRHQSVMKASIIIPAYNEIAVIEENMRKLDAWCAANLSEYQIVIVSDGSTDGTREAVKKLACDHIKDAGYEKNRGKGGALKAGVSASDGDILITTDCDLAYGFEIIGQAVNFFEKEPDTELLIGSRNASDNGFDGYPPLRKLASKTYFHLLKMLSGIKESDSQCGFKCYKGSVGKHLFSLLDTEGFAFDLEILMRAEHEGRVIRELPVRIINHGNSKISVMRDSLGMLKDAMRIRKELGSKCNP